MVSVAIKTYNGVHFDRSTIQQNKAGSYSFIIEFNLLKITPSPD